MIPLHAIPRKMRNAYKKFKTYYRRMRRLSAAVQRTAPMAVDREGPAEVHMLCSHRRLPDGIATLKSFYHHSPTKFPLVFHDDGSLRASDRKRVEHHFPGVRYVTRADADTRVNQYLGRLGLKRCSDLRSQQNYLLKLFDFAIYAENRAFLQLDSDILFFQRPDELLDAMAQPAERWVDRYNQQHLDCYTWTAAQVKEFVGVDLVGRINVGLMCLRRDDSSFQLCERCIPMPVLPGMSTYYWEQSLTAIESSRRGARPLGPEYDVCGIAQKQGGCIISEHYCDTYRPLFYDHFCERVAPVLPAGS